MAIQIESFEFPGFRGLNLKDGPLRTPVNFARFANFVDFGLLGTVAKAPGASVINATQLTNNPAVLACSEYIQTDEDKFFVIYCSDGKFYKLSYADGSATDITPTNVTIATGKYAHFFVYNGLLWFSDGVNPPIYVYDAVTSATWYELGLTAPSSAPTVATGAAGALSGTYYYWVQFVSPTGALSNLSPQSASVSPSSQQVNLTNIPVNADTAENVTKRWLYRTVAGGTIPYFLYEIPDNSTTSYTDNAADSTLGERAIEEREKPPSGLWGFTEYNSFIYGFVPKTSNLRYSILENPEGWSVFNIEPITPGDGGFITGLGRLNQLSIFKERAIDVWFGIPGLFRRVRKVRGIGAISHRTIKNVELINGGDVLFFLSQYGPRFFDEQDIFDIGREIEPIFNRTNEYYQAVPNQLHKAVAEYSPQDHKYFLSIAVNNATENNFLLIYDLYSNTWSWREPFYVGSLALRTDDDSGLQKVAGGESRSDATNGGYTFTVEGSNLHLGSAYIGDYRTHFTDLGYPANLKELRYLELEAEAEGDFPLNIDIYIDGQNEASKTVGVNLSDLGSNWDGFNWDEGSWASTVFITDIQGLGRIKARWVSLGFRTEGTNEPWKTLRARLLFQVLPPAGVRR